MVQPAESLATLADHASPVQSEGQRNGSPRLLAELQGWLYWRFNIEVQVQDVEQAVQYSVESNNDQPWWACSQAGNCSAECRLHWHQLWTAVAKLCTPSGQGSDVGFLQLAQKS